MAQDDKPIQADRRDISPKPRLDWARIAVSGNLAHGRGMEVTAEGKPMIVKAATIEMDADGRSWLRLCIPLHTCAIDIAKHGGMP